MRVVAGDPNYFGSSDALHVLNVEGVQAINGSTSNATSASRWLDNTITVIVADGKLTLSVGSTGRNTKACFIDIMEVSTAVN